MIQTNAVNRGLQLCSKLSFSSVHPLMQGSQRNSLWILKTKSRVWSAGCWDSISAVWVWRSNSACVALVSSCANGRDDTYLWLCGFARFSHFACNTLFSPDFPLWEGDSSVFVAYVLHLVCELAAQFKWLFFILLHLLTGQWPCFGKFPFQPPISSSEWHFPYLRLQNLAHLSKSGSDVVFPMKFLESLELFFFRSIAIFSVAQHNFPRMKVADFFLWTQDIGSLRPWPADGWDWRWRFGNSPRAGEN